MFMQDEYKTPFAMLMNRIHAHKILGTGGGQTEFIQSIYEEIEALKICIRLQDKSSNFYDEVKKINSMLDEREEKYDDLTTYEVRDFVEDMLEGYTAGEKQLVCQHCGEKFNSTRRHTKFCSPACRQASYRERKDTTK